MSCNHLSDCERCGDEYWGALERVEKLEAAIKQILWKLTRKDLIKTDNGFDDRYAWPKIDIDDACLNEAKELVRDDNMTRNAATISARQQTRLASGSQTQGYAGDPYRERVR
jgi:predicted outer membrane protein